MLSFSSEQSDNLWILSRAKSEGEYQNVLGWTGWVFIIGSRDNYLLSKVEYMPVINAPIIENSTFQKS